MIYFSLGLPGWLAEWCERAIALIADANGRRVTAALAAGGAAIDDAALCAIRDGREVVLGARWPDRRLESFLAHTRAQFILAMDDPRISATNMHDPDGVDFIQAARAVANICPLLMNLGKLPGALRVTRTDASTHPIRTLVEIAAHLGFSSLKKDEAERMAVSLPSNLGEKSWSEQVPVAMRNLVQGALGSYAVWFDGEPLAELVWTRELFFMAGNKASPTIPIDLRDTSNGRILVFGPYLELPSGYWSAKVVLGLSSEAIGQTLTIEAVSGIVLASAQLLVRGSGVLSTEVNFTIDEKLARPVEIRVIVGRDSTPGQLAFGHVEVRPVVLHCGAGTALEQRHFLEALAL